MKVFIARGANVWTASLDRNDAIMRLVRQIPDPSEFQLCTTTGEWAIGSIDGTLTSSEPIEEIPVTPALVAEAAQDWLESSGRVLDRIGWPRMAAVIADIEDATAVAIENQLLDEDGDPLPDAWPFKDE